MSTNGFDMDAAVAALKRKKAERAKADEEAAARPAAQMPEDEFFDGAEAAPTSTEAKLSPTPDDPLRGLSALAKVAAIGRAHLLGLAAQVVAYVWQDIAVAGTILLLASGPSEGKTTLLFLILAARANRGEPVTLLGRRITPAPPGKYLVIIEGEHSEASAARKLVRSLRLLGIEDGALHRVILVARKAVRIGSPEWLDIVRLISCGLVSDIAIDTLARVAPSDANDEREQVAIFDVVAQAIDAAPSPADRPMAWAASHTRKNGKTGDLADVSGSAQRTGQADTVLLLEGEKIEGRTVATKVVFLKLREEPDAYPLPVTFSVTTDRVLMSERRPDDERPLEARITDLLRIGPRTRNALATALGRSHGDVEQALSLLFAARAITTTTMKVRGADRRAFTLRHDGANGGAGHTRLSPDLGSSE